MRVLCSDTGCVISEEGAASDDLGLQKADVSPLPSGLNSKEISFPHKTRSREVGNPRVASFSHGTRASGPDSAQAVPQPRRRSGAGPRREQQAAGKPCTQALQQLDYRRRAPPAPPPPGQRAYQLWITREDPPPPPPLPRGWEGFRLLCTSRHQCGVCEDGVWALMVCAGRAP